MSWVTQILVVALMATFTLVAAPFEATAQTTIRAYVLIDVDSEKAAAARPKLEHLSMTNCKMLIKPPPDIGGTELIGHIQCNDPQSLNQASVKILGVDGVKRATILMVTTAT